jgi:hypothetical protein
MLLLLLGKFFQTDVEALLCTTERDICNTTLFSFSVGWV